MQNLQTQISPMGRLETKQQSIFAYRLNHQYLTAKYLCFSVYHSKQSMNYHMIRNGCYFQTSELR